MIHQKSMTPNDRQRRMRDSRSFRVLNEPTAAVLAYGLGKTESECKVISVEAHLMYLFSLSKKVIDYLVKAYDKKTRKDVSSNQRPTMSKLKRLWGLRNAHCWYSVVRRLRSTALKMGMLVISQKRLRELNSRS